MKYLQKLTLVFSIMVVLIGLYELNYEHDIFAQSREFCCNDGVCQYPERLCTAPSSIKLKPKCLTDYGFTCGQCVDYSASGQVCGDPKNSCKTQGGDCYGWCYVNGTWQWVISK
jgi:hypothetical protein